MSEPTPIVPNPAEPISPVVVPPTVALTAEQIAQQINDGIQQAISKLNLQPATTVVPVTPEEDEIVKELVSKFSMETETAKNFVSTLEKVIERKNKPITNTLQENVVASRIAEVYSKYADAKEYHAKILELLKNVDDSEYKFIINSPEGRDHLYQKAKKLSGKVSDQDRINGSGTPSSGMPASAKIGSANEHTNQAVAGLKDGDKIKYEQSVKNALRR